ncbi:hypothetical protein ACFFF5_07175 [Lederbergia wuyishanensis]|uniref:NADH dehydrogenase subunit 6 n=1 Tax=Lederbergia wuyishanensis TaxID=1347903 RepID=A0ABU0D2E7_9BACI|nr:hypothetical protein [Lederbergia wuyishanensis]MCJ8007271.1 hypothetical protein [Lederbergia wuyishanensis]MDQ0342574.1 hypothetical protein [Lederbergia wuyishanensis]
MRLSYLFIIITLLISITIGILVFLYCPLFELQGFDKALEGVLLLTSISLGFYGACLSVLASIFNTKIVKEVMEDSHYRKEFIVISSLALVIGFLTVITTIIYQVMLANDYVLLVIMKIINALWSSLLILFFSFSTLFVLISFLIFF